MRERENVVRRELLMAPDAVNKYGRALIGCEVVTDRYGAWPGGRALVIEIAPDEEAPDIVMTVKAVQANTMVTAAILNGDLSSDEIGVFGNEEVLILDPPLLTEEESQLVLGAIPLQALPEGRVSNAARAKGRT